MWQKRHENKKTDGPNKQKSVGVGEQELQTVWYLRLNPVWTGKKQLMREL